MSRRSFPDDLYSGVPQINNVYQNDNKLKCSSKRSKFQVVEVGSNDFSGGSNLVVVELNREVKDLFPTVWSWGNMQRNAWNGATNHDSLQLVSYASVLPLVT